MVRLRVRGTFSGRRVLGSSPCRMRQSRLVVVSPLMPSASTEDALLASLLAPWLGLGLGLGLGNANASPYPDPDPDPIPNPNPNPNLNPTRASVLGETARDRVAEEELPRLWAAPG